MKNKIFLSVALLVAVVLVGPAAADDAALGIGDGCQMQWIRDFRDGPGTIDAGYPLDVSGPGVQWQASPPSGFSSGFWDLQIGDAYDTPSTGSGLLSCYGFPVTSGFADWTGYTTYSMTFKNNSATDWFMADVVINTGWTDPPYGEPDNAYSAGWTWVPPGESRTVTLDLAAASAVNLNHVSNVSIKLGTNYGTGPYEGTHIDAVVNPPDNVTPDPGGLCISTVTPCVTVPVDFSRSSTDPARGASVTFQLGPELELCDPVPGNSIHQGTWLNGYLTQFQVVDNGGGSYTVDQAILGDPCGVGTGGQLFTVDVKASGSAAPDDEGTITVTQVLVRDCVNQPLPGVPGNPATVDIDRVAPTAIPDLTATQVKTGNDADGTTKIMLGWSPVEAGATVQVWRKGFGQYPEYDDNGGTIPTAPATPAAAPGAGWTLTPATVSPSTDEPANRDFWYYVAFVTDACGNISAASNLTAGTLNYHLGDVSDGVTPGTGNNQVGLEDVSILGTNYGIALAPNDPLDYLDVGPTTDYSVDARPITDNQVQFEDLILFAINYGAVGKPGLRPANTGANRLTLSVPDLPAPGSYFDATIAAVAGGGVEGLSVPLRWDSDVVEPVSFEAGDLADLQAGRTMVLSPVAGTIDAAVFGGTFRGEGTLAAVRFRMKASGDPAIAFGEVLARDPANRPVEIALGRGEVKPVPEVTRLLPAAPNPFLGAVGIRFALAEDAPVRVDVYGMDGRLIRRLVDARLPAGERTVRWDGRDESGRATASGSYLIRFSTPGTIQSQKVIRMR
jgi:hypothetical protein